MKAATVSELKKELNTRSEKEIIDLCLRLAKFKKENKELLTYLLYEADDETSYIRSVKAEIEESFAEINTSRVFYAKKTIRKILRTIKKYVRYSKKKQTEVELLLHFCVNIKKLPNNIRRNRVVTNIYDGQVRMMRKAMEKLHEDLQYDYGLELEELGI
ncbi:MAG: hypothetical protein AAGJ18_20335 [Bacteroidota bacterium]